jgi:hypothetical protein
MLGFSGAGKMRSRHGNTQTLAVFAIVAVALAAGFFMYRGAQNQKPLKEPALAVTSPIQYTVTKRVELTKMREIEAQISRKGTEQELKDLAHRIHNEYWKAPDSLDANSSGDFLTHIYLYVTPGDIDDNNFALAVFDPSLKLTVNFRE